MRFTEYKCQAAARITLSNTVISCLADTDQHVLTPALSCLATVTVAFLVPELCWGKTVSTSCVFYDLHIVAFPSFV